MVRHVGRAVVAAAILLFARLSWGQPAAWQDPSPHRSQVVTVADNVRLEVLDWGGSGKAIVLLAGLGHTAHVFDDFAPKLSARYHVYGITRRGYGSSSVPPSGYDAVRLADDVLDAIAALELNRPILVGHSIAGEEMSSLAARHSDRIGGVVYLDAAYDRTGADMPAQAAIGEKLPQPQPGAADLASIDAMRAWMSRALGAAVPEAEVRALFDVAPDGRIAGYRGAPQMVPEAIGAGVRKPDYPRIGVPVLALYAVPQSVRDVPGYRDDPALREPYQEMFAWMTKHEAANRDALRGAPQSRVVELAGANHYLFVSNESDVLRALDVFMARLK